MWWILLLSCQEAFDRDRHDLVGFRVAAVTVETPSEYSDSVQPFVAVVADGQPWSTERVTLEWHWVAEADDVWAIEPGVGEVAMGAEPVLARPSVPMRLGLLATLGEDQHRSIVSVPTSAGPRPRALELSVSDLMVAEVTGDDLQLDARSGLDADPASFVPIGGFGRLAVAYDGDTNATTTRWMATGGTFFEVDAATTDWAAGDVRLDDDEVLEPRQALDAGAVTILALSITDAAPSRFIAHDLFVGAPGPGVRVAGRWVPTSSTVSPVDGQVLRGTLVEDPTSPVGLQLADPELLSATDVTDWGTAPLPCGSDGPFDPNWLLRQRCSVSEVVDATVVMVPEISP